jgi:hypothetical protein
MKLEKINYNDLNAKAKEMYNFQKVSAKLEDYGFTTMWLNNDWQGADFIAVHADGATDIKVQLKGGFHSAESTLEKRSTSASFPTAKYSFPYAKSAT